MRKLILLPALLALTSSPALAAEGPFFSLKNTDFVVLVSFLIFIGILFYFKVPAMIGGLLDKRAATIKSELEEARALREEAQTLLASYERKQKEVQEQADRIVAQARDEANASAAQAKEDLKASIARRIAIGAARDVIAKQITAADAGKTIDEGIAIVDAKLH